MVHIVVNFHMYPTLQLQAHNLKKNPVFYVSDKIGPTNLSGSPLWPYDELTAIPYNGRYYILLYIMLNFLLLTALTHFPPCVLWIVSNWHCVFTVLFQTSLLTQTQVHVPIQQLDSSFLSIDLFFVINILNTVSFHSRIRWWN